MSWLAFSLGVGVGVAGMVLAIAALAWFLALALDSSV